MFVLYPRLKLLSVFLVSLFLLVSCGGGSSSNTNTPIITPPPPPPPAPAPNTTATTGVITGFGSVFINGVEYETTDTNVSTDDNNSASESDLQVGMVVSLTGSVNEDGKTGKADTIHYQEQLKGPLASIDLAANSLVILGQTIVFDDLTNLDNLVLTDLIPGDFLEISGFTNADGQLYATRIEKQDTVDTLKVTGIISALDTTAKTFQLAELVVNYSAANFVQLTEQDLVDGLTVRVKGDVSALVDGIFSVSQIKSERDNEQHNAGDNRHLEGVITTFNSSENFIVNDVTVITNTDTNYEHGSVDSLALNVRVKVKGEYNSDGNLVAKEIRIHQSTQLKLEGEVQAINLENKSLTVLDVIFITDEQTQMRDESDNGERFFDLSDLSVGDFVEVKGFVDNNGVNFADKLERKNNDANAERELKGLVSNIDTEGFKFTVNDIEINTNESTLFEGINGDDVDRATFFTQLADGMLVEVKGIVSDSSFTASKAKIEEQSGDDHNGGGSDHDNDQRRTEFRGIIESLADSSFVVSGHTVNIIDDTKYEVNDEQLTAEQFWALAKVGDQVKVKGTKDADGVITAKKVALEIEHQDNVAEIELTQSGTLNGEVLMVAGHSVQYDEHTQFKSREGEITLSDFLTQATAWTQFKVKGTLRDDVIFARKIEQKSDDDNEVELSAFIEAIIDNGLTVAGHAITFTENTEFFNGDTALTREEFIAQAALNSKIKIKGILTTGDQEVITAQKVTLKNHD